jgi:hypothetical protein
MRSNDGAIARTGAAFVLATALLTGCEASNLAPGNENPLLGQWTLASGPDSCIQRIIFTQTKEHTWYQGQRHDSTVTDYLVEPTMTYAIGTAGPDHAVGFEFIKHDEVVMHGSTGDCLWERK